MADSFCGRVRTKAKPRQQSINVCAAKFSYGPVLQHQKDCSLAWDHPLARFRPGGKQTLLVQSRKCEFMNLHIATAGQRTARITCHQCVDSSFDCLGPITLPGRINRVGSLDVLVYRDKAKGHVAENLECEQRADCFQSGPAKSSEIKSSVESSRHPD